MNTIKNKIGLAIITCNRPSFFMNCLNSIQNSADTILVVNDGNHYDENVYKGKVKDIIQHESNKGVCVSKNEALKYLINDNCKHLFLIEDDMLITNNNIFNEYIKASEKTGIWHWNFAYHGPANRNPNNYKLKNPRKIINYGNGLEVSLNPNCVGSLSYYYSNIIKHVGYMDETLCDNSWEHVEHTLRIIKAGLYTPYWWFADLYNSDDFIREQASSTENTTINRTEKWINGFKKGAEYFKTKHGYYPTEIPDTSITNVVERLKFLKNEYTIQEK